MKPFNSERFFSGISNESEGNRAEDRCKFKLLLVSTVLSVYSKKASIKQN